MIRDSIVLVPFPFDDFSTLKVRPAICISDFTGNYDHVIIAFISSKIPSKLSESEILIQVESKKEKTTGLTVDSVIKLHKVVSIPKAMIKRKLGKIDGETRTNVEAKLKHLLHIEQ